MIQRLTPLTSPIQVGANDDVVVISSLEGYVIIACTHCGNVRSTYALALFIPGKTEGVYTLQKEALKEMPRCLCPKREVKP